jgi:prevent-host-death family protein
LTGADPKAKLIEPDQIWSAGGDGVVVNTITEAKANLSALIERVQAGEEIVIQKAGKPVAILRKYRKRGVKRLPGALKGKIEIADDFDELPQDIAKPFGIIE